MKMMIYIMFWTIFLFSHEWMQQHCNVSLQTGWCCCSLFIPVSTFTSSSMSECPWTWHREMWDCYCKCYFYRTLKYTHSESFSSTHMKYINEKMSVLCTASSSSVVYLSVTRRRTLVGDPTSGSWWHWSGRNQRNQSAGYTASSHPPQNHHASLSSKR